MERNFNTDAAAFTGCIDLAAEKVGGEVLYANDDFFAEKENLIKAGRGVFIADKYTEQGKWMDGWESRRKRVPGHDLCIIKLGIPGVIEGVDIDTNHFLGNNPAYASVDAWAQDGEVSLGSLMNDNSRWTEVLPRVALKPGSQNIFSVASKERWTHLRLNIYPDGGVARFKVYGNSAPLWETLSKQDNVDLAAIENGGIVVCCNDMFFGNKDNLIMPGRSEYMGDGWETRRRRGPGHDWTIIKLGHEGTLKRLEVDTNHFKGNYPDVCWLEGCYAPGERIDLLNWDSYEWQEVMPRTKLEPDHRHVFDKQHISKDGPWTHIRLNIAPDGGISRLRLFGNPTNVKAGSKEEAKSVAR